MYVIFTHDVIPLHNVHVWHVMACFGYSVNQEHVDTEEDMGWKKILVVFLGINNVNGQSH